MWKYFKRDSLLGWAVFGVALLFLWWIAIDIFKFSGDEGIYLEGGRRVAMGQQPYRDFFVLTGPLTFWLEGLLAKLSGNSLWAMRLPMILETAFMVWAVYWISSRFAARVFSASLAIAYLAYEARIPKLVVNHRWDSAALATGAVVAAVAAHRKGSRSLWALSGFLAAAAAWATPPLLLVGIPLLFLSWRSKPRSVLPYLAGGSLITAACALYLLSTHTLEPMIQSLLWTGSNYAGANRMIYGQVVKMAGTAADIHVVPFTQNLAGSLYLLLPAVFPIAAVAGWAFWLWKSKDRMDGAEMIALLGAVAALVFSAWPRWTADELLYTAALSAGLCSALLYRVLPDRFRPALCLFLAFVAAGSLGKKAYAALDFYPFSSRVGSIRGNGEDRDFVESLERHVKQGESVFAFPYLSPMYYFLDAHNPTRYTFLQPGMMNVQDEANALAELQAAPPHWVIFENLPAEAILILWPGSSRESIAMTSINTYLRENYRDVDVIDGNWGRFVIKERVPPASVVRH